MRDAFTSRVRAGYCRLIVANPLHPGLPKLILMVQATCNRFKAEDVRNQWTRLDQLWNRAGGVNLRTILGPLIGHGSDGDARRFKLQLEDMSSKVGNRFSIAWGGLTLTGVRGKDGNVRALHSQDPIHNSKKGINPLDVASRRLQLGGFLVIWEHLCLVMNRFPPDKHGLKAGDKAHFDRQDFRLVQRVVAPDVRTCLRELRPEHQTQGTETWLEVMYMYLTAHFSDSAGLISSSRSCCPPFRSRRPTCTPSICAACWLRYTGRYARIPSRTNPRRTPTVLVAIPSATTTTRTTDSCDV